MKYRAVKVGNVNHNEVIGPGLSTLQDALDRVEHNERLHSITQFHEFNGGTRSMIVIFERDDPPGPQ